MTNANATAPICAHRRRSPDAVACDRCVLNHICEPLESSADEVPLRGPAGGRQITLKRGDALFHKGDPFHTVYALSRGSVKLVLPRPTHEQQVMGFRVAGELVGLNGIANDRYLSDVYALEDTEVCALGLDYLEGKRGEISDMDRRLLKVMGEDLVCDQYEAVLLGKKSAVERLAAFILGLAERYERHGCSGSEFSFAMTRVDLADYLGLAKETVSRLFIRFRDQHLIANRKRRIQLLDLPALRTLAGPTG